MSLKRIDSISIIQKKQIGFLFVSTDNQSISEHCFLSTLISHPLTADNELSYSFNP